MSKTISSLPNVEETCVDMHQEWKGTFLTADVCTYKLPDGSFARRDILRHPGAVAVIAVTDDNKICMVQQFRAPLDRTTFEIPAGKLDKGESGLDAAKRELEEETGIQADKMAYLTALALAPGYSDEIIHLYLATGLHFAHSHPDSDEFLNVFFMQDSDLIDMVLDGQLEDAKTVSALLIWDACRNRME